MILGLLNQSAVAGAESLAELKHSARLGKTFLVRWVVGWLRKVENKAKAQHSWGLGLAEFGNKINRTDEIRLNSKLYYQQIRNMFNRLQGSDQY